VKIDRPVVPVAALEPTSKKVLVRPCAADKSKDKNITIGIFLPDKRKAGGAGGKHDQTSDHGHLSCVHRTVRDRRR
jgi:hypothetical protein